MNKLNLIKSLCLSWPGLKSAQNKIKQSDCHVYSRTLTDDTWENVLKLWDFHTEYDELKSVDVVICLGSYDLRVAERYAEIIDSGLAKQAIVTGNLSNWTKKLFSQPEAEVFSKRIIELGVDPKKLLLEREATNLGENVIFSRRLCRDQLPSMNTPIPSENLIRMNIDVNHL